MSRSELGPFGWARDTWSTPRRAGEDETRRPLRRSSSKKVEKPITSSSSSRRPRRLRRRSRPSLTTTRRRARAHLRNAVAARTKSLPRRPSRRNRRRRASPRRMRPRWTPPRPRRDTPRSGRGDRRGARLHRLRSPTATIGSSGSSRWTTAGATARTAAVPRARTARPRGGPAGAQNAGFEPERARAPRGVSLRAPTGRGGFDVGVLGWRVVLGVRKDKMAPLEEQVRAKAEHPGVVC